PSSWPPWSRTRCPGQVVQGPYRSPGRRVWNGDERLAGPHEDRPWEVHPAALARGRRRQQDQPFARPWVDPENFDLPPGLHAVQVEAGNEPVVGEAEREV